jgi:carbonic anhydrase
MKFIEKKLLILLVFIVTGSLYGAKTKKNDASMGFYNKLFMQNSESRSELEIKNLKNKNLLRSMNDPAANAQIQISSDPANAAKDTNSTNTNNGDEIPFKGWLKISSALFRLQSLFPPIRIIDSKGRESTVIVKVDKDEFRINENLVSSQNSELEERDFFFKLTNDYLYYSVDEKDINVLHTIPLSIIAKIEDWKVELNEFGKELYSFVIIEETTKFSFRIATYNKAEMFKIYCSLSSILNINKLECNGNLPLIEKSTVIKEEIVQNTILIPIPSRTCNENWNYQNKGDDWECSCKDGLLQSPIDLPKETDAILSPVAPLFKFDEVNAKSTQNTLDGLIKTNEYIKIRYYNNALRILHHNLGKIVTLNQAVYVAEEITFHSPSEHTINGKRFDMEMQVVFYGISKGDIAKQVILSFLFQKKAGFYNKFLDDVDFYSLPNQGFQERDILSNLFVPKVFYSSTGEDDEINDLPSMKPFSFFTYDGSLTMPPCSEDTIHYVASEPIPIASVVLELAKEALRKPNIEEKNTETGEKRTLQDFDDVENYRNIQERKNRPVFFFDHKRYCGGLETVMKKKENKGHYEKIHRKISEFIYVPGTKPSNIPGAFVVSEKEAKNTETRNASDLTGF